MDVQPLPPQTLEIVTALRGILTEPQARTDRAPNHLDQKLKNTCESPRRNVLLDTGFQAWFAYIRADARTRAAVDQLPDSEAREVARNICSVKPHPTVETLLQHILYGSFRNRERCSLLEKSGYSPYPRPSIVVSETTASPGSPAFIQMGSPDGPQLMNNNTQGYIEQPRPPNGSNLPSPPSNADQDRTLSYFSPTVVNCSQSIDRGAEIPPLMDNIEGRRGSPPEDDHQPVTPEAPVDRPRVWQFPDARNIPILFPARVCSSIVKADRVASVRAISTDAPSHCSLEIDLYATKVPCIAMELFSTLIDIEDEGLVVKCESGASISSETFTLRGADRQATEKLLGKIFTIVSGGMRYKQEIERGEPVTHLVTLEVKRDADRPSCLKVQSDEKTISAITAQLWPAFPHTAF